MFCRNSVDRKDSGVNKKRLLKGLLVCSKRKEGHVKQGKGSDTADKKKKTNKDKEQRKICAVRKHKKISKWENRAD